MKTEFTAEQLDAADVSTISEYDMQKQYDEMLNECYPVVDVCGDKYKPAYALKELDPTGYNVGFDDYSDEYFIEITVDGETEYLTNDDYETLCEYLDNEEKEGEEN